MTLSAALARSSFPPFLRVKEIGARFTHDGQDFPGPHVKPQILYGNNASFGRIEADGQSLDFQDVSVTRPHSLLQFPT